MANTLPRTNFNLLPADTMVGVGEQRILLIGQKSAQGSAKEKTLIRDIPNDNSWEKMFGEQSILANMIRQARALCNICQYQVKIDAIALDDGMEAVASEGKVTFAGTAKQSGELLITVGSKYNNTYKLPIAVDDTHTAIATKLSNIVKLDKKAPFTVNASQGDVTFTFVNKGTIGNDTTIIVNGFVDGITTTITKFTKGATDPVVDEEVLKLIQNTRYTRIVSPIEYGIDKIKVLLDTRFNTNNRIMDGALFVNKTDTLVQLQNAGKALNSQNVCFQADKVVDKDDWKGSSIPEFSFVKAVYNATLCALRVSENSQLSTVLIGQYPEDLMGGTHNNSLPYFNTTCPLLDPIYTDYHWTDDEIKELNQVGLSVWNNNLADNGLVMGEQLTTYKTDKAGNEDITWKFLNYRDTGSAIREYRFKNFKKDFAQYRLNDTAEQEIRNAFIKYYKVLASDEYRLVRAGKEALKFYADNLKVAVDYAKGTVTVICKDPYVTQLREVNGFFKATFNLSDGSAV